MSSGLKLILVLLLLCGGTALVSIVNWFLGRSESPIDPEMVGTGFFIELIVVLLLEFLFKMDNLVVEILIATVIGAGVAFLADRDDRKNAASAAPKKLGEGYYHGNVRELIAKHIAPSMLTAAANHIESWYFQVRETGLYIAYDPSSYESAGFAKTLNFTEVLSPSGIEDLAERLCGELKHIVDISYQVDNLSRQPICEILPGHRSVVSLRCWDLNARDFDKLYDSMCS